MKKIILLFLCVITIARSQSSLPLIPLPNEIKREQGNFILSPRTAIVIADEKMRKDADLFNDYLIVYYGYSIDIVKEESQHRNYITLNFSGKASGQKESYSLTISQKQVSIIAESDGAGFFYALQTLTQLIPPQEKTEGKPPGRSFEIPCLYINDSPRYQWRGMHLDVCRHFFPKQFIKKYIDLLALYKFNTFHWHLTEDQGWRIEIKKYPKLTEVGAWRNGTMVGPYKDQKFDKVRYGGFYTQDEIKEIVAYAAERHITIVPEIELPGHSVAAISAYPYLSCERKQIEVAKGWGVFNDVYCPTDSTFQFLEDVLTEVVALFPGKYIHIGGDECPKDSWKKCDKCQNRIRKESLKDEHELQSYFIKSIEKFLNSKGKQIIGWDEILEGGLAPNAAVMSWRGTQGGIDAARQKHFVVMTPGKPCYFDHYQSQDKKSEPLAIGGYNPLDSVYAYDPTPKVLGVEEQKFILGAQGNVWTEYIQNEKQVEYMAVPRMCALAEVLWTDPKNKNYNDFIKRLSVHRHILDNMQVNYAKHFLKQVK